MYPAPPVTRMLRAIVPLETEQFLQRFEETVSSAGLRGLLECGRGMVQELVEQRVTELLHLGAILGRQMRETFERALQLSGTHVVEPLRSEEHTSELQSQSNLVCRLLLEKKKKKLRISHSLCDYQFIALT